MLSFQKKKVCEGGRAREARVGGLGSLARGRVGSRPLCARRYGPPTRAPGRRPLPADADRADRDHEDPTQRSRRGWRSRRRKRRSRGKDRRRHRRVGGDGLVTGRDTLTRLRRACQFTQLALDWLHGCLDGRMHALEKEWPLVDRHEGRPRKRAAGGDRLDRRELESPSADLLHARPRKLVDGSDAVELESVLGDRLESGKRKSPSLRSQSRGSGEHLD